MRERLKGREPRVAAASARMSDIAPANSKRSEDSGRVELLAPARDWDCARAAVENGADAIYFGLGTFNARMRAANFTEADLPVLMEFLHRRGVRGYVSFNTLVFAEELGEAERLLRVLMGVGVDAAIVQDVGVARMIRRLSPDFPMHASTQMTISSAAGVAFARELGCQRVILARECSLEDIARIQADPAAGLPLEVFVHGALCVAFSGQCLTSEALGGRSANRGVCAQACRLPYDLIADGRQVPLGERRYLLSPRDLAALELLPDLLRLGVRAFKIEGRLKSPEYVANICRIYRQVLDSLRAQPIGPGSPPLEVQPFRYDLEMAFSRGLWTGWFRGVNNQALVHARFGKKRGVFLGEVVGVEGDRVLVGLQGPLKPGDGVVFDAGRPDQPEEGGRVYTVELRRPRRLTQPSCPPGRGGPRPAVGPEGRPGDPSEVWLTFGRGDLHLGRVRVGDKLWKTSDPELERRLRQSFAGDQPRCARPMSLTVTGRAGQPLRLIARDESGHTARVASAIPLAVAERQPLTADRLREQLGRLGGTGLRLDGLTVELEGEVLLPVSELNRMRRDLVARFLDARAQPPQWRIQAPERSPEVALSHAPVPAPGVPAPHFWVLGHDLAQLDAAWRAGIRHLYCELEDPRRAAAAVRWFRDLAAAEPAPAGSPPSLPPATGLAAPRFFLVLPRITKPGEDSILDLFRACQADGYLIRNYDHLGRFDGCRCVADFSFNLANPLAAHYFRTRYGLARLTAAYDLNPAQLETLLRRAPPEWFEITLHQRMPLFHMEHCLFCAFLSTGANYADCGHPCERHELRLRDRVGALHVVRADAACRNTVFHAVAQTGAEHLARWVTLGARHFRLEFLNETPREVTRAVTMYQRLLRGELTGAQLWRQLKLDHRLGVAGNDFGRWADRP